MIWCSKKLLRRAVLALVGVGVLSAAIVYPVYWRHDLVQVANLPSVYPRRAGDFWVYVTGETSLLITRLMYRINGSEWRRVRQAGPRAPRPQFTIEIPTEDLRAGDNELAIRAEALLRPSEESVFHFEYDPMPVKLPVTVDWADAELDSQDGIWEVFQAGDGWRVRPKPGYEGYDRLLAVTGAFAGGRRVETDVVFHGRVGDTEFGFGIFPLWGGHPERTDYRPRRGWSFSLAVYWDRYGGVGNEISIQVGDARPAWVNSYRSIFLETEVRYRIEAECFEEVDSKGRHLRYRQFLRWWRDGEAPPRERVEIADTEGSPLPPGEYAVGLYAYNSKVDFGPLTVEPLEPRQVGGPAP